jgi:hypothetical protein
LSSNTQVIFVTDPDFHKNKEFLGLVDLVPDALLIDFYTMDMEELSFIAKFRVLPAYTILVIQNGRTVMRLVNKIPKKAQFRKMLKDIGLWDGQ